MDGTTEEPCRVVGLEGEPKIDEFIHSFAPSLQGIANHLRSQAEDTGGGGTRQANDPFPTRISELADQCCAVLLSAKDTSGYKDLITAFVRLGLGEMLAAVMRQVDAAYIGISQHMFDKGKEVLKKRDELVFRSNSAQGKARGAKANKRPNIQCTLRSTLTHMCKVARDPDDRASFTSFVCALAYSITQGQDTDMLDQWRISQVTGRPWVKERKKEGEAKDADEKEKEEQREGGREGSPRNQEKQAQKKEHLYCGSRNILHQVSHTHLRLQFQFMFRIFVAGGFWLVPHAHAPFNENMLRDSCERPKVVLMKQVHECVSKSLGLSVSGGEERPYSNWWTLAKNKEEVKEIFSKPKEEMEKMGWRWITVNPKRSAVSMAFTLGIVLHNIDPSVCQDKKKSKKNKKDCKEEGETAQKEEEDEKSEQDEAPQESEESSDSDEDEEEDLSTDDPNGKKRKRMKGGKTQDKKRGKKEKNVLTVEKHEEASSITLDVFSFLLGLKVPDDNVSADNYLAQAQPIKRTRNRKPRGKLEVADPHELREDTAAESEEVVCLSPANEEERRREGVSIGDTVRNSAQLPVHSIGPLPSDDKCYLFREGIFSEQAELCEFVVAVEHVYLSEADFGRSRQFPKGQLFAVFSHEDSTAGNNSLIVFRALPEEKEGKVQFKVHKTPEIFDQDKQACFSWTFLDRSEVGSSIHFNADARMFWFEESLLEKAVAQSLGSKKTLTMFEDAELLDHVFGNDVKDAPCSLWLIDTHAGGGTKVVGFEEGADSARRVIEHALAANTEHVRPGPVRFSAETWKNALVARTTFEDLKTYLKKGRTGAKNESPLALYVDLLNVGVLEKIKGSDCATHWEHHGCESICVVEVIIDHSSKTFANVGLYTPSWWCDRRCTDRTKFIVLVGKKDSFRRSLLSLVRNLRSNEDVKACTTVIQGCDLHKYAPKLWEEVLAVSDPHVFLPRNAPTGFLSGVLGVGDIRSWTASQRLTSPHVPGDGACWLWSFVVLLGITPCLTQNHPSQKLLHAWALFWAPVANRLRQMVAAVLFAVRDAYRREHGDGYVSILFGEGDQSTTLRRRWEQYFGDKPDRNILNPTAWGTDLELLVASWLLNINLNIFDKKKNGAVKNLETATATVFHHDCLKKSRVTLTQKFPTASFSSMKETLPAFCDFVTVDASTHAGDHCAPSFVEAFGFFSRDCDVLLLSTLAEGIARGVLDAHYESSQSSRSSLFMMFDTNHYSPLVAYAGKVVCARNSAGGDVISARLNGFGRNTPVTENLLDLAADLMLKAKSGDMLTWTDKKNNSVGVSVEEVLGCGLEDPYLYAVHACADNSTVTLVADVYKAWNGGLQPVELYKANLEVADNRRGVQRCSSGKTTSAFLKTATQEQLQLHNKLRKDTKLLVPLRAQDVRSKAQGSKNAKDREVLRCMLTMRCYKSVEKAHNNGRHAGSEVFGVFSVLQTGPSPSKCNMHITGDGVSPSGNLRSNLPETKKITLSAPEHGTCGSDRKKQRCHKMARQMSFLANSAGKSYCSVKWIVEEQDSDISGADRSETSPVCAPSGRLAFLFFSHYCSLKALVHFLCKGIGESREYLTVCARFRQTCKDALEICPLRIDLWRAAFYAQSPQFKLSHAYLGTSIRATVVPASETETVGTKEGSTQVRGRLRFCQQLVNYISPRGGWGMFAAGALKRNLYLTEYSGRYLDDQQVEEVRRAGKASHIRTVVSKRLHIDGNPEQEGFSRMSLIENHQASVWNRVSF